MSGTPWRYRALGQGFRALDRVTPGWLRPALTPEALIRAAKVQPDATARAGLSQLMKALAAESELTLFGEVSIRWDMIRLLRNAAMVDAAHERDPSLAATGIMAPIFILGLPRSGTSFLHALLAEDPGNAVPRNWQTIYPAPRPPDFDPTRDKRACAVNRQLSMFAGIAPGFSQLHPIDADSPQECSEITAHVFRSYRFDTIFRVPGYLQWLEAAGDLPGFAFHKRFLQVLQNGVSSRWVLKCPDHTFSLDAILGVYPDARFVIVHRDPVQVLASNARLTEVLRKPFLKTVEMAEIGRLDSARWAEGAARLLAFDRRVDVPADRKFHIRHEELITTPLAAVSQIYEQFGLTLEDQAKSKLARRIAADPRGGYVRHAAYPLSRFSLTAETLRPRFAAYVEKYCV